MTQDFLRREDEGMRRSLHSSTSHGPRYCYLHKLAVQRVGLTWHLSIKMATVETHLTLQIQRAVNVKLRYSI